MAHDVNQLEVISGEQQAVEVLQADVHALVILEGLQQSGNDRPLLFNPRTRHGDKMFDVVSAGSSTDLIYRRRLLAPTAASDLVRVWFH